MKFTFTYEDEDGTESKRTFESSTWYDAADHFVLFLRGCGYLLKDNSLGINLSAGHLGLPCLENLTTFEGD